jgi:cellulose synthase/poly-beta-1,6-N-acetylglucosamine synthase-like glycosyltransferase
MVVTAVAIGLLISYAFLIAYYCYHWWQLPIVSLNQNVTSISVSVVIAARNEALHLPALLQSLQAQDYPAVLFEVIIIDDHSTDDTGAVFNQFKKDNFQMLLVDTAAASSSKKKAIAFGVSQAKGDLIVITDADCVVPPGWIRSIVGCQQQHSAQFVAAPVMFAPVKGWLGVFQALDFMVLQGITAASVYARFHSMANGANLAYTQSAFHKVNGFEGIDQVASGDDMLLMYKIWKQYPDGIAYLKSREAIVQTPPMPNWKAFIQQRKRWASKTLYYDDKKVLAVATLVYFVNVWALVLLGAGFFDKAFFSFALYYILIKLLIEFPFVISVSFFYKQQKLLAWFPFFQPLHILYTVSVGVLSQMRSYEWKGRRTK